MNDMYHTLRYTGTYWQLVERCFNNSLYQVIKFEGKTIEEVMTYSFNPETGRPFELVVS
jgi:hypothetical protein